MAQKGLTRSTGCRSSTSAKGRARPTQPRWSCRGLPRANGRRSRARCGRSSARSGRLNPCRPKAPTRKASTK
eukprot:1616433-Alexandrium_andersonii.AAC.1